MLPLAQPYQTAATGDSGAPLFQDVGTRVLRTVRVGENAGKIASGAENVFAGYDAGREARGVTQSVCIGYQAGAATLNTANAVFVGAFAGAANQGGAESVFVGFRAGETNRYGDTLTAVGAYALRENYSGSRSTAVGYRAMERVLDGDDNTAVGAEAGQGMRSGGQNAILGFRAGRGAQGSEHCYLGAYAGYSNAAGVGNALVGYRSGEFLIDGSFNVGVGAYTLQYASAASSNVALGAFAGASITAGSGSVLVGFGAGSSNAAGNSNVILGAGAAAAATGGSENVIAGADAGLRASGDRLVILGARAAPDLAADGSVIVGHAAALGLINGSNNIMVGPGAATYTETNYNGICIGTQNAFTSDYTITVGEEIQNKRARSILVGFSLQSDANNSVIIGNDITLASVLFFKDPIAQEFAETVRADAAFKFGISNIAYGTSNQLLVSPPPENTVFLYGTAGLLTSNVFSTAVLGAVSAGVSPASYDLRAYNATTPTIAAPNGSNTLELRATAFPMRSNADLARVVPLASAPGGGLSNVLYALYASNAGPGPAPIAFSLADYANPATSNLTLGDALYASNVQLAAVLVPPAVPTATITNFYGTGATAATTTLLLPLPKRAKTPAFTVTASNVTAGIDALTVVSPAMSLSNEIVLAGPDPNALDVLSPAFLAAPSASPELREALANSNAYAYRVAAPALPGGGALRIEPGVGLVYDPFPETAASRFQETFTIEPVLQIQGAGIPPSPSDATTQLTYTVRAAAAIDPAASNVYVADRVTMPPTAASFLFSGAEITGIPPLPGATGVRFITLSPDLTLTVAPRTGPPPNLDDAPAGTYTSNALAQMVVQEMDTYATANLPLHIAAASTLADQTIAKNTTYLTTYVTPALTGYSNTAVGLSNAMIGIVTDAAHTALNGLLDDVTGLLAEFAARTSPPPIAADVNALASGTTAWFSTYDVGGAFTAEQSAMTADINTVFANYVATTFVGYDTAALAYATALAALAPAPVTATDLAAFYTTTQALLASALRTSYPFGDPPSPGGGFATTDIVAALDAMDVLYDKYVVRTDLRLYLTLADLVAGRVTVNAPAPATPPTPATPYSGAMTLRLLWPPPVPATTAPATIGPYTTTVHRGVPTLWTEFPYAATQTAIAVSAPVIAPTSAPMGADAPALPSTGALYVLQEPSRGGLVIPDAALNPQFSNVRYVATDPWRALDATDAFALIAESGDQAVPGGRTTVATASVTTTQSGAALGAVGPIPVPAPSRDWSVLSVTNAVADYTQTNFRASNVDIYFYTIDGGAPLPEYSNIEPIVSYDPLLGYHTRTSNITVTSNLAVTTADPPGSGAITWTYNYGGYVDTSNMFGTTVTRTPISYTIVEPPVANVLYPNEDSNYAVTYALAIYDFNGYAFDVTYDRRAYSYSNTAYKTFAGHWISSNETYTVLPPEEIETFATTYVLADGPLLYETTCNHLFSSNIEQRDPYVRLNRHYLYTAPVTAAPPGGAASVAYSSVAGDGTTVLGVFASNVNGAAALVPQTSFTQADVDAGRLFVRVAGGAAPAPAPGTLSLTATPAAPLPGFAATLSFQPLTTPGDAAVPDTAGATPIGLTLDPVTLRSTTALGPLLAPPPATVAAYAPQAIVFKPQPTEAPVSGLAAGYFYHAPTGERRLTYTLAELAAGDVQYALPHPSFGVDVDTFAFYYTDATGTAVACDGIYQSNIKVNRSPYARGQAFNLGLTVAPGSNLLSGAAFYHARPDRAYATLGVKVTGLSAPAGAVTFATPAADPATEFLIADVARADGAPSTVAVRADPALVAPGDVVTVTYDLYGDLSDPAPFESGRTFALRFYDAPMFPRPEAFAAAQSNVGAPVFRQSAYGTVQTTASSGLQAIGTLWDSLAAATVQGVPALSNVYLDVLSSDPPEHGFLRRLGATTTTPAASNVLHSICLADLRGPPDAASNVFYTAAGAAGTANDAMTVAIRYDGAGTGAGAAVSPPLPPLPIQNYLSRFLAAPPTTAPAFGTAAETINVGLRDPTARTVAFAATLPISDGLRDDGYEWRRVAASNNPITGPLWLPAQYDPAPTTTLALVSTRPNANGPAGTPLRGFNGVPEATDIVYAPRAYVRSVAATLTGGVTDVTIDQADRLSLRDDLGGVLQSAVTSNAAAIQDLVYYVTVAPTQGVLYRASAPHASVAAFTDADLAANDIFYQHNGAVDDGGGAGGGLGTDSFRVTIATTPYDVAATERTIRFQIRPLPSIVLNTEPFAAASNVADAVTTRRPLAQHLALAAPSASNALAAPLGYVHTIAAERLAFVAGAAPGTDAVVFPGSNIGAGGGAAYRFTGLSSCNAPTVGTVAFTVNHRPAAGAVNAIVTDPYYGPLFARTFRAHLNDFRHSNAVLYPDGVQATDQTLEYTLDPATTGASNLAGRIVTVGLQVNPQQGLIAPPYTDWLNTYAFDVAVLGADGATPILTVQCEQSNIRTERAGAVVNTPLPVGSDFRFAFGQWGNLTLYNRDPDNDGNVSLYVNADLFTNKETRIQRNVLQDLGVAPFEFGDVRAIRVRTDLAGPSNLYGAAPAPAIAPVHVATPNAPDPLAQTFQLSNYATTLLFRNLEIAATTYDYDETAAAAAATATGQQNDVQNVILGRDVIVRGVNNICIGNHFSTSGADSIILGNDIGVVISATAADTGVGQINDIYESIIIGNNSYQNSIVRNVISIGRNILNDLYLSPLADANAFLSQGPIIIGNNVTTQYLDYHVNLGNTFLHTQVGGPQIYLGLAGDVVGIGYGSNQRFAAPAAGASNQLYVRGGVAADTLTANATCHRAALVATAASATPAVGDWVLGAGWSDDANLPFGILSYDPADASNIRAFEFHLGPVAATPPAAAGATGAGASIVTIASAGIAVVRVTPAAPGNGVYYGDYIGWSSPANDPGYPVVQSPADPTTALARAIQTVQPPIAPETTVLVRCKLMFR